MTISRQPILSAIVAMSENGVIGSNNKMPWHLPADLSFFKTITSGHPVIMGRKTFESIGKPLPNRTNIILSRDPHLKIPGCVVAQSLDEALLHVGETDEVFIIGGAEIYKQTLHRLQRVYLSLVHHQFKGDTFFPSLNPNEWREVERIEREKDERNDYAISFIRLER